MKGSYERRKKKSKSKKLTDAKYNVNINIMNVYIKKDLSSNFLVKRYLKYD